MTSTGYRPPIIVEHPNTRAPGIQLRKLHGHDTIVARCAPGTEDIERLSLAFLRALGKTDRAYRRSISCELLLIANLVHRPDIDRVILTHTERLPADVVHQLADISAIANKQLVLCFASNDRGHGEKREQIADTSKGLADRYDAVRTGIADLRPPQRQNTEPVDDHPSAPHAPRVHPTQFLDTSRTLNSTHHHAELASAVASHLTRLRNTQTPTKAGVEISAFKACFIELLDEAGSLDEVLTVVAAAWIGGIHTGIYVDFDHVSVIAGYDTTATSAVAEANGWWAKIDQYLSPEQGAAVVLALAGLSSRQMANLTLGDVRLADNRWRETKFSHKDLDLNGQRHIAILKYYRQLEGAGDASSLFHTNRHDKPSDHARLQRLVRDPKNDHGISTHRPIRSSDARTLADRFGIQVTVLHSSKIAEPQPALHLTGGKP